MKRIKKGLRNVIKAEQKDHQDTVASTWRRIHIVLLAESTLNPKGRI